MPCALDHLVVVAPTLQEGARLVTQALGATASIDAHVSESAALPGDLYLLCSDGLWHYFSDSELGAAIAMNSPREASEMLIKKARERAAGSNADNCTLAIVKLGAPAKETKNYTIEKMKRAV